MKNNRINGKIRQEEVLVEDTSSAPCAYVIKGGKAKIFKKVDGKRLLIGIVSKGESFWEMAFLGETQETVSVVTNGKARVEMITRNTFMDLLSESCLRRPKQDERNYQRPLQRLPISTPPPPFFNPPPPPK